MKTAILLSIIMGLFMPGFVAHATAEENEQRQFELRTHTTHPNKLDALHARFRDHTNKIFAKNGTTMIGYWTPDTPEGEEPNTRVNILAYSDWQAAHEASHEADFIVMKVEQPFRHATDYSPIR